VLIRIRLPPLSTCIEPYRLLLLAHTVQNLSLNPSSGFAPSCEPSSPGIACSSAPAALTALRSLLLPSDSAGGGGGGGGGTGRLRGSEAIVVYGIQVFPCAVDGNNGYTGVACFVNLIAHHTYKHRGHNDAPFRPGGDLTRCKYYSNRDKSRIVGSAMSNDESGNTTTGSWSRFEKRC
jgi:hypothetical protein